MTEKEFLYAALCNHGQIGKEMAQKFIEDNPKAEYSCDDWIALFYSAAEPVRTGLARPLMKQLRNNGTFCYTTKQWD